MPTKVDAILDQHHIANVKAMVDATRGIGHDQGFYPQHFHDADRQGHLRQAIPFVKVKRPGIAETVTPAISPITSRPAWPWTVLTGK